AEFPLPPRLHASRPSDLPLPPAMPKGALLLRMLLSTYAVDLQAITEVITNDVGLTVRLLHLAGVERLRSSKLSLAEIVVQIGLAKLRTLAEQTTLLPASPGTDPGDHFWAHARLTAHIAEELSIQESSAVREMAHLAGLLRRLSALPEFLKWSLPMWNPTD